MGLPSTGPLKFSDIQTEFGGTNPVLLSEYYAGGAYVPSTTISVDSPVPTTPNTIAVGNFRGAAATDHFLITVNARTSISESGVFIETYDNRINGDPVYAQQLRPITYDWPSSISLSKQTRHGVVTSGVRPGTQNGSGYGNGAMTYFSYNVNGAINIITTTTQVLQNTKAGAEFSPDGNSIAYATGVGNKILFFDHTSPGSITLANQYTIVGGNTVHSPRFNPAGDYILFQSGQSTILNSLRFYLAQYDQSAKNITNISTPINFLGREDGRGTEFHPTTNLFGVVGGAAIRLYSYVGVVPTLVATWVNPEPPSPAFAVGGADIANFKFTPDGNYIVYSTLSPTDENYAVIRVIDISNLPVIELSDEFIVPGDELGGAWNLEFSNSGKYLWASQIGQNSVSNQGRHFIFGYLNGDLNIIKNFVPFVSETSPIVAAFTPKFLT